MNIDELLRRLGGSPSALAAHIIEILILATIIYLFLRFMRGTRAAAILRGLFFLLLAIYVLLFVGDRVAGLDFDRLSWAMGKLVTILLLAVLVIFQPEIRRALVRLGRNPLFAFFARPSHSVISEVVKAATELSKRRVGALIALQREVGLGVYIEHGVRLDSDVSAELLCTIFRSTGPLHDGAVILRRGRIAAAGCLFPLSENPGISRSLGTRHRAAVGVTEESDAVTVAVSEETGRISLGVRGELKEGLTPEELRERLLALCPEEEAGLSTETE